MADKSSIEWTDATWNPITGCSVLSPGCTHCYAMKLAGTRLRNHPSRAGLTIDTKAGPVWNGQVRLNVPWLRQPLEWKRPRMVFVCAHGDLFHESVPDEWIDCVFIVMAEARCHTFQVLTKRAERMRRYVDDAVARVFAQARGDWPGWPLPNVWLGISAERQQEADERIPLLLQTPAAVRFISAEPLLGPIDLTAVKLDFMPGYFGDALQPHHVPHCDRHHRYPGLDQVITGGESGPNARPSNPQWYRDIRDQCASAGVPYFHKQNGEWVSVSEVDGDGIHFQFPDGRTVRRVGKKRAGRRLDGVEHNGMPERAA